MGLSTEHGRLVDSFTPDDVIADMFAGVGPFALPAARMGAIVHANDLNPSSAQALEANAKTNGVADKLTAYNMDGRDFIRSLIANAVPFTQVAMNLPAMAPEFLDVFVGAFSPLHYPSLPRVTAAFGGHTPSSFSIHFVRSVAPRKDMYCISLSLPEDMAYSRKRSGSDPQDPPSSSSSSSSKRQKPLDADAQPASSSTVTPA